MSLSSLGGRRGTPLRIGLVGGGTVGGGVYEILMGRLSGVAVVTKLCVRDATKRRDFAVSAEKTKVVTDIADVYQDANVDVVVEVMGGTTVAKTLVQESLQRHKAVVTANKALLAEHLDELDQMVVDSNGKASLAYEAAVCGGIPIIHTLQTCFTGDVIYKLMVRRNAGAVTNDDLIPICMYVPLTLVGRCSNCNLICIYIGHLQRHDQLHAGFDGKRGCWVRPCPQGGASLGLCRSRSDGRCGGARCPCQNGPLDQTGLWQNPRSRDGNPLPWHYRGWSRRL